MMLPQFVNLEHNVEGRKAVVSVEDREVRKQREMWGMYTSLEAKFNSDHPRNHTRLPTKSHFGSFRRSHCDFEISWSWLQGNS